MEIEHISREAAWNGIYNCPTKTDADGYIWVRTKDVAHMIDDIPAADVRPVVQGEWEKHEDFDPYGGGRFVEWVCSECDKRLRGDWVLINPHIEKTPTDNFCPNCGADMRGKCND